MDTEVLVKLAASGNVKNVEEEWLSVLENETATPETLLELLPVLETLAEKGRATEAATLAWTTIEMFGERFSEAELLPAAGGMLLVLNKSKELRQQVTGLYRQAFADRPNLEALLEEAGIEGGRPVRRAVRTLDVCLALENGTYLAARHEDTTAQVVNVDGESWNVVVKTPDGECELGPVEVADQYMPVEAGDYRILRDFHPDQLVELVEKDPARIVISILRDRGNKLDSDQLRAALCPSPIEPKKWSRWWTKARNALRRTHHVDIEGRSPHYLTYHAAASTLEEETEAEFIRLADAQDQYSAIEGYLRECKARQQEADPKLLATMRDSLDARAQRMEKSQHPAALAARLVQRRVEEELNQEDAEQAAVQTLAESADPASAVQAIEVAALWPAACTCLEKALPERRVELLAALLPLAPLSVCKHIASRLADAGFTPEQFDELAGIILSDTLKYHSGLCWLWDGAAGAQMEPIRPLTLLSRLLALLSDIKRSDSIPREKRKRVAADARTVLTARRFERFKACLEDVGAGMASTVRTQVNRLDNLGRAAREDLSKIIRRQFPELDVVPTVSPWADENVLWTTPEGLVRKQQEVEELVNVKMKENAKRIGEAASHGDLSENSEYKFALEERDLLRARLAQMQESLALARSLTASDVPTDHVGVGSKVSLRHVESGTTAEIRFLGPWDADIDRHIYNYQARFSQSVMGKTVGENVTMEDLQPPGEYQIVGLDSAMA